MRCSNCAIEVPLHEGPCPNCGAPFSLASRESFGKKHPAVLISITLAAFVLIVGSIAFAAYTALKNVRLQAARDKQNIVPGPHIRRTEFPVEHGNTVGPEELRGHGTLYFVPVGSQAIPAQSLADYYKEKFGATIAVLPAVAIHPADCVPERRQCVAEELGAEMTAAYSDIARNPDSVMIALTDEDIYPREFGWKFTYSLHNDRIGIVSTRRMDPSFWGNRPEPEVRLAATKQMLTKYVAMLYYHVPESLDPTSVMYTPLTPDGGSDDLHESDLHSEASANGRRGTPYPCLFFAYSYQTHQLTSAEPALADCKYGNPVHRDEETFEVNLASGELLQRSLDVALNSVPAIEYRRGYNSGYAGQTEFHLGWGTNHSYNTWLSSDGLAQISYIDINGEANMERRFERLDSGRGFNANSVYENHDYDTYGSRLKWESGHYKLEYRDGAQATYLPCSDRASMRCYWIGYEDAQGHTLLFDRGPDRELHHLTASDLQGINFEYDEQHRIVNASATDGKNVAYAYDAAGCLAQVTRADGQVTLYTYDAGHHMTSVSVVRRPGGDPEEILSIEYDARGRIVKHTLANIGEYRIDYLSTNGRTASELRVTDPGGQTLTITMDDENYVARAQSVRFPRVVAHR
jgi:YD repeat-containing protein